MKDSFNYRLKRGLIVRNLNLKSFVCFLLYTLFCLQTANSSDDGQYSKEKTIKLEVKVKDTQIFGKYVIKTYREKTGQGAFYEILIDGSRRYAEWDRQEFAIGADSKGPNPLIAIGKDVTGNGIPNLVIRNWSGSAGGGGYYIVFQLCEDFRKIDVIDAPCDGKFSDVDGDGFPEFITYDESFRGWNGCCNASSPYPKVVLRYSNGRYHIAADQMRKSKLTKESLVRLSESLKNDKRWHVAKPVSQLTFDEDSDRIEMQSDMAKAVLDLIYSGHFITGWQLFDESWPEGVPGKKEARDDLKKCLNSSRYLMELQAFWERNKKEEKNSWDT